MGILNSFKKVEDDFVETEDEVTKKLRKERLVKLGIMAGAGVVVVLVLILIMTLGGKKSDVTFYDLLNGVFTNELGSFTYNFEVQTMPKGETSVNLGDSETEASTESSTEEESSEYIAEIDSDVDKSDSDSKYNLVEWGSSKDITVLEWNNPSYHISITGCTKSVEPLEMQFSVAIKTQFYNNEFTDVVVKDDTYYINVESMRNWLVSSKDSYLVGLGSELPQGSKYLMIPASEFGIPSRYAEISEKEVSKTKSILTMYRRFVSDFKYTVSQLTSGVGSTGLSEKDGKLSLNLSGADAINVLKSVKAIADKQGDFYTGRIQNYKTANLVSESEYEQMMREKDNVMEAFHKLSIYMNMNDITAMNPIISGVAQQYQNGSGKSVIEVTNLRLSLEGKEKNYNVSFSGRREGNVTDIVVPSDSTFTKEGMSSPSLVQDTINGIADYFNVTPIMLSKTLELRPERIVEDIKQDFIDLVNSYGYYNKTLTQSNLQEFMDKYVNYVVNESSSDNDVKCAKIASDFVNSLNSVTGGLVKEAVVEEDDDELAGVEKYPETVYDENGLKFIIKVDEKSSTPQFIHATGRVEYSGNEEITVNTEDFSVKTILTSSYPANNEILIRTHDSMWDTSTLDKELVLAPNTFKDFDLYFVVATDDTEAAKHLDLYYGDTYLGVAVEY